MFARLAVIQGEGIPNVLSLPADKPVTIGRSKTNHLVLCDISASRKHAEVRREDDTWFIRDLSMNGTYVGEIKIDGRHALHDGDVIRIADMKIQFLEESTNNLSATKQIRPFLLDELQSLYRFMSTTVEVQDPRDLVQAGLETIYEHTRIHLCGYWDVDPDNPHPKIIYPAEKDINADLSQRLTKEVKRRRKTVRLSDAEHLQGTGSVASLHDAICIPVLTAEGDFLGAFHVYKIRGQFSDREIQFCEVLVAYATQCIARLRQVHSLTSENSRLRGYRRATDDMIGNSAAMQNVREIISKVAPKNANVLILGESGSGKEVVATQIHRQSRRSGLLVATNCAAIQKELMESELFGHCKGAFTGATDDRPGVFQQADGGTLFLDEIGDMSAECQAKLLRVLEGHPFKKLGGVHPIHTNVRVVSATNKNLVKAVEDGLFRQDLLFRLDVVTIKVPPLRERSEDIPTLAEHFLKCDLQGSGKPKSISPTAMERLQNYSWPGNVRELKNVLERAVILSDGDIIDADDLRLSPPTSQDLPATWNKNDVEAWHFGKVIRMTNGNQSKAAEILGINRETVAKKLKQYNLA